MSYISMLPWENMLLEICEECTLWNPSLISYIIFAKLVIRSCHSDTLQKCQALKNCISASQCRANIWIFVSEYWIFEYEYWKFDFSNIFVFIFGQKLSFVKGEYSNIFGYSNFCLWILDIRIQIYKIWLFK